MRQQTQSGQLQSQLAWQWHKPPPQQFSVSRDQLSVAPGSVKSMIDSHPPVTCDATSPNWDAHSVAGVAQVCRRFFSGRSFRGQADE
jgi:hypothetical protein